MKNRIMTFIANLSRRPALWLLVSLIKSWRKHLPKFQHNRYRHDGSFIGSFFGKAAENSRRAIHAFDQVRRDRAKIRKSIRQSRARASARCG